MHAIAVHVRRITVLIVGIGPGSYLGTIAEPVTVGVRVVGIGTVLVLILVEQSVAVRVERRVVRRRVEAVVLLPVVGHTVVVAVLTAVTGLSSPANEPCIREVLDR